MEDMSGNRSDRSDKGVLKPICLGILAHVDAGKTTLSEGLLYISGSIRKLGRVDNGDAFLDTFALERERGITIFSKQALISVEDKEITLLDTPGHVDFSAEMERTLQVLDYAILVVSGADGVQGHTETLWRLLTRYQIPVFLFVNKMDQEGTDREALLSELKSRLDKSVVAFCGENGIWDQETMENLAVCDEEILEHYLETGVVEDDEITGMIAERKVFPCFFGSALKLSGVEGFLKVLGRYTRCPSYPEKFGAKVFKIARDVQGNRLTYLKVTGGTLRVKDILADEGPGRESSGEERYRGEKVNQIRIYSGAKYETVAEAGAGTVCAVTGLTRTFPGEGIGAEEQSALPMLEPVLTYRIQLPEDCDAHRMLENLRQLEEEEPLLHITWNETLGEIQAQLMGEVQIDILKSLIWERFGVRVGFGAGNIVYKETIASPVEGVGHFEPLRHYAEVHLRIEPGEPGSGMQFLTDCSEDMLDRNWQRLILTHLEEKEHRGVLTGAAVTDLRITLTAGRAHIKHTEGGDFRQATYRAVRQGLRKAESILLEPYYGYRLTVPTAMIGRALSDIQRMHGTFGTPQGDAEMSVLSGEAPVSEMRGYQTEVISYTKGRGRLACSLKGYRPCHNAEEVIAAAGYDPERDLENPTGSVFCAHGAGFVVRWDQVEEYMHINTKGQAAAEEAPVFEGGAVRRAKTVLALSPEEEKELERMVQASMKKREASRKKFSYKKAEPSLETSAAPRQKLSVKKRNGEKEYFLVDGYNIIFSWEELKKLGQENMDAARGRLQDILSNYQAIRKCTLILVFDAYKLEGFQGEVQKYHNIYIVFTKEAETADQYIEKVAHEMGRRYSVTVATSDGTEQVIILGQGCRLISAQELKEEIALADREMREELLKHTDRAGNYLFGYMDEEMAGQMEEIRLGKREI